MLRISKHASQDDGPVLVLEGRLVGPWVGELRRAAAEDGLRAIDLAGVSFADAAGVAALRELRGRGMLLTGASDFVVALLGIDDGEDRSVG